jgi:prevent-host-death family protein
MQQVNMHEAKTRLSELVRRVEISHVPVVLCRNGEPVAQIIPFAAKGGRLATSPALKVKLRYDPTEPLGEDEVPAEYR